MLQHWLIWLIAQLGILMRLDSSERQETKRQDSHNLHQTKMALLEMQMAAIESNTEQTLQKMEADHQRKMAQIEAQKQKILADMDSSEKPVIEGEWHCIDVSNHKT